MEVSNITWIPCDANWTGPVLGLETSSMHENAPLLIGYTSCIAAAILYGCHMVPLKLVNTGDGMFSQWLFCCAVWLVGLGVQLFREQPQFYSLSVIGGAIWALGNCASIPVMNLIGLGSGVALWNVSAILIGWATSRYGLFGLICAQVPSHSIMNTAGVTFCVLAVICFALIKTDVSSLSCVSVKSLKMVNKSKENDTVGNGNGTTTGTSNRGEEVNLSKNLLQDLENLQNSNITITNNNNSNIKLNADQRIFMGNLSQSGRRWLGVALALGSGVCYGLAFVPWNYIRQHTIVNGFRSSRSGLDYVFTQFSGILAASTSIFFIYSLFHEAPHVCKRLLVPSLCAGFIWGTATVALFVANELLSVAITFPIIGSLPGIVASLFGVLVFKEINGYHSILRLIFASILTVIGVVLTAWSKHYEPF